jgi:hypothetical protein
MDLGCTSYEAEAAVSNDSISKYVDANNAHIYFGDYQPENDGTGNEQCNIGPYGSESTAIKSAEIPATTKPFIVTETGYTDDCCSLSDTGYVSPTVKTKYLLRSLLIHYHAGAAFSYVYELATEGQSYGLTDQYLNPKPAYTALENFIHIMQDPGGTRTGTLYAGKSSGLTNAVQLLFEKKDGSFWLIIWNPAQSWNPATNTAINVAPLSGTLTFATKPTALKLYVFNPATGAVTATSYTPATTLNITVSDMPEILQIGTTTNPPVLATPQPPKT